MKQPEEIKKGLAEAPHIQYTVEEPNCIGGYSVRYAVAIGYVLRDDIASYIQQLESSRWELFNDLSTAYYGKQMYGLNDDGTVYSRYSCDTMSFEQAVDEFRRLIADE
jgi:hypothetical protein